MSKEEFEQEKVLIRSILLPFKDGCTLHEFRKEYSNIIGAALPHIKYGYNTDLDLLYDMQDVVMIHASANGLYHLMGVPDQNTLHISKMVSKQKISKTKVSSRQPRGQMYRAPRRNTAAYTNSSTQRTSYNVPPRMKPPVQKDIPLQVKREMIDLVNRFNNGVNLAEFMPIYERVYKKPFSFKNFGFVTLEDCLSTLFPELYLKTYNNEITIYTSTRVTSEDQKFPSKSAADSVKSKRDNTWANYCWQNTGAQGNIYPQDHSSKSRVSGPPKQDKVKPEQTRVSSQGNRDIKRQDSLYSSCSTYSAKQHQDTLSYEKISASRSSIPTSSLCNTTTQAPASNTNEFISTCYTPVHSSLNQFDPFAPLETRDSNISYAISEDTFDLPQDSKSIRNYPSISEHIKSNLRKVIEKYPQGIWAVDFPSYYEMVSNSTFDLHSLGFTDLHSFVDSVPEILLRKSVTGSKKDWLICGVDTRMQKCTDASEPKSGVLLTELIISNTRRILQGYSEGIRLSDFLHVYSINCNDPLYITDLGFSTIEDFLLSIAERVPLHMDSFEGLKTVHLKNFHDAGAGPQISTQEVTNDVIPPDATPPNSKYQPFSLPHDFDFNEYILVYTSAIQNPSQLCLQFVGDELDKLEVLQTEMEDFYCGPQSSSYQMQRHHIKPHAVCAAIWPDDDHWYRALIKGVLADGNVQVFYVDYGIVEVISVKELRYIKKEYMELPLQAVKSRLAHLRPANNASQWDKSTKVKMLQMCRDVKLMARIENVGPDGVISIILCDTNDEKDFFINDELVNQGLADADAIEDDVQPQDISSQLHDLATFFQAAANVSRNMPPSMLNPLINNMFTPQLPVIPPPKVGAVSAQSFPTALQQNYALPVGAAAFNPAYSANFQSMCANMFPYAPPGFAPIPAAPRTSPQPKAVQEESPDDSSDENFEFDDDDDDQFAEFEKKVSLVKKRFVKRLHTQDGYRFHIILVDSQPYVSVGDVSAFIWPDKKEFLIKRLQLSEDALPTISLPREGNDEIYNQLTRYKVKGLDLETKQCIILYHLKNVTQILNKFGQSSSALRKIIKKELSSFNPSDPVWLEFNDAPEEEEEFNCVTDDDKMKINRLNLYDLQTMKSSIEDKWEKVAVKLMNCPSDEKSIEEKRKLEEIKSNVVQRLKEVKRICTTSTH